MKLLPRAHPESLVQHLCRGNPMVPLLNLFWLSWVVVVPWVLPLGPWATAFTGLSLLIFLPLYFGAWWCDRARLPVYTGAIAVLGLVSLPINTCWSYIVYASSLVVLCGTPRQGLVGLVGLLATFAGVASVSPFFSAPAVGVGLATCLVIGLFNCVYRGNARRDAELRLTQDEVRRLAASAERERIGRDLHDLLGATLSLIAIKSELARRLLERDPAAAGREVADIEQVARGALAQVRSAVSGIRAAELVGELAAARLLLEASGLRLVTDLDALSLTAAAESAFALGLREAVTNAQRHARASCVTVKLRALDAQVRLSVQDDGRGGPIRPGNGLAGMTERLQALGGGLDIQALDDGTRLVLHLPDSSALASAQAGAQAGALAPAALAVTTRPALAQRPQTT